MKPQLVLSSKLAIRDLETRRRGGPEGYRAAVVKALSFPGTKNDICKRSGVMKGTVVRWLRILQDEGVLFICNWHRTVGKGGDCCPVYKLGKGISMPKPGRLSDAEYSQRYRDNLKHQGLDDKRNARKRAKYMADAMDKTRDPLIEALFGQAKKAA